MKTTDTPDATGTDLRESAKPVGKTGARNVVFLSAFLLMALAALSFTLRHHPVTKEVVSSHQSFTQTQPVNVRFKGKHSKMALSTTGYTATGAGTTAANGTYVPCAAPNATWNGATQYTNATDFLAYGGSGYWLVSGSVNPTGTPLYYVAGTTTTMPLTGWLTASGTTPAPTFTASYAPTVPTAPGTLTMTIT